MELQQMIWFVIILTGVINFTFRLSMFSGFRKIYVPAALHRYVAFVPASVLCAIIASSLVTFDGQEITYELEKLAAASVAVTCALLTKSVAATLIVGLLTVWIL
jgi:branched-subunit amino acid transport protein